MAVSEMDLLRQLEQCKCKFQLVFARIAVFILSSVNYVRAARLRIENEDFEL